MKGWPDKSLTGLVLDNYDSFTYNLYQLIGEVASPPHVFRNDAISLERIEALEPDFIVISPGPGDPTNASYFGVCGLVIEQLARRMPVLGVCLGHQGIACALGGSVARAAAPMHGKTSLVYHDGGALFAHVPSPFQAMRYHSLVVEPSTLPEDLEVDARTREGTIMALHHRRWPLYGVQFHPESIGTPHGATVVRNFVSLAARWRALTLEGA